jgi:hypothetical protein
MRGKKVKAIRRLVYGDMADVRRYGKNSKGVIRNVGLRAAYQRAKKLERGGE